MSEIKQSSVGSATKQSAAKEYLAFMLAAEHYAVDILLVQEIRGYSHVTHLANAPAHIKGIVNLRGVIVPLFDMRVQFGMLNPTYDEQTIVIVLKVLGQVIGVVVDAVSDVVQISDGEIMPSPRVGEAALTEHIVGVATHDDKMLIMLDIEKALADEGIRQLDLVMAEE